MAACTVGYNAYSVLLGKPVSSSCPIEMSPPEVVVRFGDPLRVKCSSSSKEIEGMGWESSSGGTGNKAGVSSVTLDIKSVNAWDIGPLCFINLQNGSQCVNTLPVTVYSK